MTFTEHLCASQRAWHLLLHTFGELAARGTGPVALGTLSSAIWPQTVLFTLQPFTMLRSQLHSPASFSKFQGHQGYRRTGYNADCPAPPPEVLVQLARAGAGTLHFLQLPRLCAAGALTLKILCNRRTDVRRKARASSGGLESLMMKVKFFPEECTNPPTHKILHSFRQFPGP